MTTRQADTAPYGRGRPPRAARTRGPRPAQEPLLNPAERALLVLFGICVALSLVALECWGSGHMGRALYRPGDGHPLHGTQRLERTEGDLTVLAPGPQ